MRDEERDRVGTTFFIFYRGVVNDICSVAIMFL